MQKPLVIYHAPCRSGDGFAAAFAAWLAQGDAADYLGMNYLAGGEGIPEFRAKCPELAGREVYILDFSLPKPVMQWLWHTAAQVTWLDHHKSAFETWVGEYAPGQRYQKDNRHGLHSDYPRAYYILLDDNKSGAVLAWEHFHPGRPVPLLYRHIDDYDRWVKALDGTEAFIAALQSYPETFADWSRLFVRRNLGTYPVVELSLEHLYAAGEALLRARDRQVAAVLDQARPCEIEVFVPSVAEMFGGNPGRLTFAGWAANCPEHIVNEVGNALALRSGTFGLCWLQAASGEAWVSLRSLKGSDTDVSRIAGHFSGGGQATAAGLRIDMPTLQGWLR